MNYESALETLKGRDRRKLENNTYLEKNGDYIAVRLHDTNIITFYPDKTIVTSGGWKTLTTKDRLNKYLPLRYSIYQANSIWYYTIGSEKYVFEDGMILSKDGTPSDNLKFNPEKEREIKKLKRQIRKYSKDFVDTLKSWKIPSPSNGDCWYCSMRTVDKNVPLGEVNGDKDHILSHLDEGYYVPSLLVRAIEVFPVSIMAKNGLALAWNPNCEKDRETANYIPWEQIEKSIARYMYRQMGVAT